ncbi:hypothetical protein OPKNFCMD_0194 [Methylobacterium crusticola]|uniref:Glucosamine inositolphosphorylceramide transferase 1 N-terminal domain-containing protein n=1 Tax=Methylobacterium crusticola TaxID=1697972 RepID=A0ABQ4QQZ3_9HYPH|nr:formyl transferase [Methylobacterium crusticola]GJD47486.1 hypothetical protein OPKNFCMD_0194 [Methylobacterium crusticola]
MLEGGLTPREGPAPGPGGPAAPEGAARIVVRLDPQRLWRWQVWLLDALAALPGRRVAVAFAEGRPYPAALRLLLELERPVFRLKGEQAADLVASGPVRSAWPVPSGPADLLIDLAEPAADGGAGLCPLYNGCAGDEGLVAAVMAGAPIRLRLSGGARPAGGDLAGGDLTGGDVIGGDLAGEDVAGDDPELLPAVESRTVLTRALNRVFSAVLTLCLAEAGRPLPAPSPGRTARPGPRVGAAAVAGFAARTGARKLAERLTDLCTRPERWHVGWRRLAHEDAFLGRTRRLPEGGYTVLPDDGRRYYADPFLYRAGDRRFLFVEEYCYARRKGLISAAEIAPDGSIGTPRPVLEEAHHLSYPFVFGHAGAAWMIPESSVAGRVELYRAAALPDRWERAAILLDGIAASDVTLTRAGGLWWMFACTHPFQASVRDTLSLFSAPDLLGPWTPHPRNPVVLDLRAARPGGHLYRLGGELWRPAQDASGGYGSALALCRVDALTPTAYRQTLAAVVAPGPAWARSGLHTLNRDGTLEVVDGMF